MNLSLKQGGGDVGFMDLHQGKEESSAEVTRLSIRLDVYTPAG
jgi:hypothetical protein